MARDPPDNHTGNESCMTKPTLVITRGYPGSGKTTLAREWVAEDPEGRVRLNRDDFRRMMFNASWGLSYKQEQSVTNSQHAAAAVHLVGGRSVIADDTNLRARFARNWADLAVKTGAEFQVIDVTTDADECVRRDAKRIADGEHGVGEDVIRMFAQKYPLSRWGEVKPSPRSAETPPAFYEPDWSKRPAWIVDIDGTLAHMVDRGPYDLDRVGEDTLDDVVSDLVDMFRDWNNDIVIVSGREDSCRDLTEKWLADNLVSYEALFMRRADDKRPDYIVKAEIFDEHIRDRWNVIGVLDDRDQVVKMWRSIGLKTLQVAEGAF